MIVEAFRIILLIPLKIILRWRFCETQIDGRPCVDISSGIYNLILGRLAV